MSLKKISVLAIDDDSGDLKLLEIHLGRISSLEISFTAAKSWDEASELMENNSIDIIFIDYLLGAETGGDIVKAIRDSGDERPIILLTGQGNEHVAAEVSRAGADDYLLKENLQPEALRRSINAAIERSEMRKEKLLLQDRLRHVAKMESLDIMAGSVAHHFNNQLMAVLGNLELLEEDIPKLSPLMNFVEEAKLAALNASKLSTQMLLYVGQGDLVRKVVNLEHTFKSVLSSHDNNKEVTITTDFADDTPFIVGDPAQFHQLVENILANAYEAIPEDGTVSIQSGMIDADEIELDQHYITDKPDDCLFTWFEISDTGVGMDNEALLRIFDPFFTTKFIGRGLGLSVAIGIIRKHKGLIDVSSTPGKGTSVRVYLPSAGCKAIQSS